MEQVSRLIRLFNLPHHLSHACIVADGCPGRVGTLLKLVAHIAGFKLGTVSMPLTNVREHGSRRQRLQHFHDELTVHLTNSGVKVSICF